MPHIEQPPQRAPGARPADQRLTLSSPAFADGAPIPKRHTADGEDVSPSLTWSGTPAGTTSLALICEDPDAPSGSFVHWLAWNIGAEARDLREGVPAQAGSGIEQGENDFGRTGYGGPKPPPGKPHRYVFRLFALDAALELANGATRADFERAIEGHILAEAKLVGLYQR